jgi:hypothetical protein
VAVNTPTSNNPENQSKRTVATFHHIDHAFVKALSSLVPGAFIRGMFYQRDLQRLDGLVDFQLFNVRRLEVNASERLSSIYLMHVLSRLAHGALRFGFVP